jgi:hypothetical protein
MKGLRFSGIHDHSKLSGSCSTVLGFFTMMDVCALIWLYHHILDHVNFRQKWSAINLKICHRTSIVVGNYLGSVVHNGFAVRQNANRPSRYNMSSSVESRVGISIVESVANEASGGTI